MGLEVKTSGGPELRGTSWGMVRRTQQGALAPLLGAPGGSVLPLGPSLLISMTNSQFCYSLESPNLPPVEKLGVFVHGSREFGSSHCSGAGRLSQDVMSSGYHRGPAPRPPVPQQSARLRGP